MSNLIVPTSEQARVNGSKGGKKRAENARKRKALKEQLEIFLKLPLKNEDAKETLKGLGIETEDIDNQMAITVAICQRALKGDTRAYELIRDTIGEKPAETINNINLNYEDTLKKVTDEDEY